MKITKIGQGLAWVLLMAALGLVGCGGGSSSKSRASSSAPPATGGGGGGGGGGSAPQTITGVFVDGPVAGVSYTTTPGGKSGVTSAEGEYDFIEGDKVTFSIGGIVFPEVEAKGTVTPLDMGGEGADLFSPVVRNILRVLQTLDDDNDPENGISISAEVAAKLNAVDITDFSDDFDSSGAVDAIEDATERPFVEDIAAAEHFTKSLNNLLAGSWLYVEKDGGQNLLTFLPSLGEYLIAHDFDDGESQKPGTVEHGSYEWDVSSGQITVNLIGHSDGSGGFISGTTRTMSLSINGDTLTFVVGDDGEAVFKAVRSATNELLGAWFLYEPEDPDEGWEENLNVLTIFPNNEYVIVHSNNQEPQDGVVYAQSSEWGTYTVSAGGAVQFNKPRVETDGEGGLYDEDASSRFRLSPELNGDLNFLELDEDEPESFAFRRLDSFSFTLSDGENEREVVLTRRDGPFQNEVDAEYVLTEGGAALTLALSEDGTGTLDSGAEQHSVTEWQVNSAGTLMFKAGESHWWISPVMGKSGNTVLVELKNGELSRSTLADLVEVVTPL